MNKGLIALACGGLAIGMTEFTMMGILQDIAKDQQIEITEAAHFIALYALGVVVGAPILTIFTGKIAPKKVLIILMLLFVVFNGLFAIAPEYNTLAIARFMSGLPHGAFFWCRICSCGTISSKRQRSASYCLHVYGDDHCQFSRCSAWNVHWASLFVANYLRNYCGIRVNYDS